VVERRGTYRVLVGNLRERNHSEDRGVDGRILFIWVVKNWDGGMDWIYLTQDRAGGGVL